MASAKHITTEQYLEGMRAYIAGQDESDCPYGDKVNKTRWAVGWTNASASEVSRTVRQNNLERLGYRREES